MWKLFLLLLSCVLISEAQTLEFGGYLGGGPIADSSAGAAGAARIGIEACVFCSGRLALFGEYAHWAAAEHQTGFGAGRVSRADLAGAGLRIQGLGRLPVFFDAGIVGGSDHHGNSGGGAIGGVVVGGGVTLHLGDRWYIRPQIRAYALSPHTLEGLGIHWAVAAGAGFGVRF
jgi:hypothetical protein